MNKRCSSLPFLARHISTVMTIALIMIALASPCQSQDAEDLVVNLEKRSNRQTYCGPKLVDSLKLLCNSQYNDKFPKKHKKNLESPDDDFLIGQAESDLDYWQRQSSDSTLDLLQGLQGLHGSTGVRQWLPRQSRFPFRERLAAATFLKGAVERRSRGVIEECCSKACSIDELRYYCAD